MKFIFIILAILYVLSPYDCIPDIFPGLGWIDDITVLGLLFWFLKVRGQGPGTKKNTGAYNRNTYQESGDPHAEAQGAYERWDPYSILGLERGATLEEIKKAYKELAQKYHPDRVNHLGKEFQELAEKRFKEINRAYQEITANRTMN